ncbi:MAG: hypothetical protein Q4E99_05930 [Bacillota bacterium]|nr:hypothetical protein [Bacillota bacterium]
MEEWSKKYCCNSWRDIINAPNGKWYIATFNIDGTYSLGMAFDTKEEAEKFSFIVLV